MSLLSCNISRPEFKISPTDPTDYIPTNIWVYIMKFLPLRARILASTVCRTLYRCANVDDLCYINLNPELLRPRTDRFFITNVHYR